MEDEKYLYLEQKMKELIQELKNNNCLSEKFSFFAEAERQSIVEENIDIFLSQED